MSRTDQETVERAQVANMSVPRDFVPAFATVDVPLRLCRADFADDAILEFVSVGTGETAFALFNVCGGQLLLRFGSNKQIDGLLDRDLALRRLSELDEEIDCFRDRRIVGLQLFQGVSDGSTSKRIKVRQHRGVAERLFLFTLDFESLRSLKRSERLKLPFSAHRAKRNLPALVPAPMGTRVDLGLAFHAHPKLLRNDKTTEPIYSQFPQH